MKAWWKRSFNFELVTMTDTEQQKKFTFDKYGT